MKRLAILMLVVALTGAASAQSVTVKTSDAAETEYSTSDILYIDFTADTSFVDLGLSVMWAKCNVGSAYPEVAGKFYSWGEVNSKTVYADSTYQYSSRNSLGFFTYTSLGRNISGGTRDAATVALGEKYRMPTRDEMQELVDSCQWEWGKIGTRYGYWVTGPSGARIFLPAGGCKESKRTLYSNKQGYYWTATYGIQTDAYCLNFGNDDVYMGNYVRWLGRNIRPVKAK